MLGTANVGASSRQRDRAEPPGTARTHTPRTLAPDVVALVRAGPRLLLIYTRSRVDPALRERVMVAVSRANACRQCSRVHEAWALCAGVPAAELGRVGPDELAGIPAAHRPAVVYATALAEARFNAIPPAAQAVADEHLGRERQRDIEVIARLITFANLSVNTAHAGARRLRAKWTSPGAR